MNRQPHGFKATNHVINRHSARLYVLAAGIVSLVLWTGLRVSQQLFPHIPLGITIHTIVAGILGSVVIASLISQRIRRTMLAYFDRITRWLGLEPLDALLILLAPFLSLATWSAAGLDRTVLFPTMMVFLWIVTLIAVIKPGLGQGESAPSWHSLEISFLIGITLLAFLLRAVQLGHIPWLLSGDEGSIGLSAVEFLEGRWNSPFNLGWFSFPSLFFTLPAASIRVFGNTTFALRLPSAIAGSLTVFAVYVYARRAFGRQVAVIASALLTGFHFHIHFSRLGLNNIWDGFFYVVTAGSLWRAWVRNRASDFIWPGIAWGFSIYFYATTRFLPIMLLVWLAIAFLKDRQSVRQRAPGLLLMLLAGLSLALPMMIFFAHHPPEFMAPFRRVGSISGLADEVARTGKPAALLLLDKLRLSSLAFFSVDLRMWYKPDAPMLLPLASTLFGLGGLILIVRGLDLRYTFLVLWLSIAIGSSAASGSTPAAQRYVFAAPVVSLIIAFGLSEIFQLFRIAWSSGEVLAFGLVGVLLLNVIFTDLFFYFGEYSAEHKFSDVNTEVANEAAEFLQGWPPGTRAYFLGGRMGYYSHSTIPYLVPHIQGQDLMDPITDIEERPNQPATIFLILPERKEEFDYLKERFPEGIAAVHPGDKDEILFYSYSFPP